MSNPLSSPTGRSLRPRVLKRPAKVTSPVEISPTPKVKGKAGKGMKVWLKCRWCDYKSYNPPNILRHERLHNRPGKFPCPSCNYATNAKSHFNDHVKRCHTIKSSTSPPPLPDESSGYTTEEISLPDSLKTSSSSSSEEEAPKVLAVQPSTRKRPSRSSDPEEAEVFRCPKCSYWARRVHTFHDHYLSSHNPAELPFRCSACGMLSKYRARSDVHIRQLAVEGKDPNHIGARTLAVRPVPDDEYAACLRMEYVPADVPYGWIDDSSSSSSSDSEEEEEKGLAVVKVETPPGSPNKVMRMDQQQKCLEEEEARCRKRISQLGEAIHAAYESLNEAKKKTTASREVQAVQSRVEVMKEKVRAAQEEVDSALAKKEDIRTRMKEAVSFKVRAEIAVRTHQCRALQIRLSALEARDDPDRQLKAEEELAEVELNVRNAEEEVDRAEGVLQSLRQEADGLEMEVEEAEESRNGASQVMRMVQSELSSLLDSPSTSTRMVEELKGGARKLIREYAEQEEHLVKIIYLRTLAGIRKKEEDWMEALDRQYDENESLNLLCISYQQGDK